MCDISEMIRRHQHEIDWQRVRLRAQKWGVGKYVPLTLWFARELLDAPVPEDQFESLVKTDGDMGWMAFAEEQILGRMPDVPSAPSLMSWNLAKFLAPSRCWPNCGFFLRAAFPAPQVMRDKYHLPPRSMRSVLVLRMAADTPLRDARSPRMAVVARRQNNCAPRSRNQQTNRLRRMVWVRSESGECCSDDFC